MLSELVNPAAKVAGTYQLAESSSSAAKSLGLQKIYKMNSNENPFGVSPLAAEAMAKAAYGVNYYPDSTGAALRRKLAQRLDVKPENIVVTEGASVALTLLAEMFLNPGDEVIEHWPTYSGYQRRMMDPRQAVAVKVPIGKDSAPDFDAMLAAITERTKMILICNPSNPTGVLCDADALLAFARKVPSNIILLVDEAYIDFVEDPDYLSAVRWIGEFENLVVTRTYSKIYGMAGARIGYAVACPEMIGYYNNMVNFFCASSAALAGAEAALDDEAFRQMTREKNREGREFLTRELRAMGFSPYPSSTNFIACDFGMDPMEITNRLRQEGILIRGNLGVPRITIGTREANEAFLAALRNIIASGGD